MKNKYQEALNELRQISASERQNKLYDILQELVDKETPTEPLHISLLTNPPKNIIVCGKCDFEITEIHKYCSQCGYKIKWSKDK